MPGPYLAGGIYLVPDKTLRLIPEESREIHDERRPVVVITGGETNGDADWPFVLICPISGSTRRRTRFDVQLSKGQGGATKKCWIRVPAVQPLMKDVLEDRAGVLDEELLTQVQGRLAQYLGLLG
ncbi:type II toxin-antitoxin system PemK/MazF family toxin [Actinomadura sp. WMMA1423]|uniref:type II toxin-antitoxin system PemK/MazF family toxin n=1 Tax=Actinomadura sp. WMMA1423 TaxID=2591108 RepID=UPI0011473899|nr:type II toxin-antitoxin system PemK/MazF family toxin [Actinomadura sp. WMMA1423]